MGKEREFIEKVGKKIKEKRVESNYTQLDFSILIGMEDSSLRRIEAGKTNPTLKTLYKIAEGLNLSICDLIRFED